MPTSYDLSAIRAAIKTLLQQVTELSFVYDRRNPTIEGYPCAIFDITDNRSDIYSNVENERRITFTIWLIQEIGTAGAAVADGILDDATQAVIAKLEDKDNISLSGLVDWIMPTAGKREEVSSPEGSAIWQVLNLEVRITSLI